MHTDNQVERVGAGTAMGIGVVVGVSTAGGVLRTMPGVVIAGILVVRVMCTIIYGQEQ